MATFLICFTFGRDWEDKIMMNYRLMFSVWALDFLKKMRIAHFFYSLQINFCSYALLLLQKITASRSNTQDCNLQNKFS